MAYRIFISEAGALLDLEEIYQISCPLDGYGELKGSTVLKISFKQDNRPHHMVYDTYEECKKEYNKLLYHFLAYKDPEQLAKYQKGDN